MAIQSIPTRVKLFYWKPSSSANDD